MHDNRIVVHSLLAWLVYLTWKGIGSRLAHQISHQEHCCRELLQGILVAGLSPSLRCTYAEACLSVCTARCRASNEHMLYNSAGS